MKRFLTFVGAAAAVMLLPACFELSSVISVNNDGSGSVEETTYVSAQVKAMLGSMKAGGGQPGGGGDMKMDLLPTKEKAAEKAKKMGDGVTVKSHEEVKAPDGREGVKVVYAFTDINKINYEPGDMKDKGADGKKEKPFAISGGTLTITNHDSKKAKAEKKDDGAPKPSAAELEQQMAMMRPMLAGMKMSFKVKAAGGIASTDATHVAGDTITIMEMNFDQLLAKPEGVKKFAEMAENKDMSPAEAAEAFKGLDGVKIEPKEKVTVKLK